MSGLITYYTLGKVLQFSVWFGFFILFYLVIIYISVAISSLVNHDLVSTVTIGGLSINDVELKGKLIKITLVTSLFAGLFISGTLIKALWFIFKALSMLLDQVKYYFY